MRKTFFSIGAVLALLFIGIFALKTEAGQEENGHDEDNWHHRDHPRDDRHRHAPVVVYEHAFKGQTASIPLTTLFTPDCNCMYRVSVYHEQPNVTDTLDLGLLTQGAFLSWTDDFGQKQIQMLTANGSIPIESGKPAWFTHDALVHSVANQPIQFNTFEDPRDHSAYDMYVVVEEL